MLRRGHYEEKEAAGKTEGRQKEDETDRPSFDSAGGISGLSEHRQGGRGLEIGLSCYLHVPFCRKKCRYCAFYSEPADRDTVRLYLEALRKELSAWNSFLGGRPTVDTLYIGGGTPTFLNPQEWESLIEILENGLSFSRGGEVSVEANPDSLSRDHLQLWRTWRVNRVSLGIQSFSTKMLRWLGRLHDEKQAEEALKQCAESGFASSGDLIFGIPGQDLRLWHNDLQTLIRYVNHLSIYQLTAEPGTPLAAERVASQSEAYPLYRFAQWYLSRRGFLQYEIASFARNGSWCRHNLSYWRQANVLALGPSAWGYLDGLRYRNVAPLSQYLLEDGLRWAWTERLPLEGRAREAAILALRTRWGIRWKTFRRRFGEEISKKIGGILSELPCNLFEKRNGRLSLSGRGFRLGNAIWERLV
jgi:oxygen-independent coproporphyrinogen-3 oxidase